ncbi:pre-mRNA-splicing factor CWC25 homolog isoform X1 [Anolis carolinensis]|uniref:pre-mRNA-splicing factor CWC25 homolog isoform X1 n=1 Tax=Anolis carolinensis TaxID=28377 RepID=UPI002F2B3E43
MGGGDLNLKKSWHPQTLRNVEKVWKAEQKHEAERKKIEELQRELHEERAREEMQRYAEDVGAVKKKDEKLEWMYQGPGGMVNREEYLMGRPVDKYVFEPMEDKEGGCSSETGLLPGSIFAPTGANSALDMASKIREDPLFMIRKREEEKKREVLNNPVKMKKIKELLQSSLDKKKKKKKKDKKKKHKKHRHHSPSSSDDEQNKIRSREKMDNSPETFHSRMPEYGLQIRGNGHDKVLSHKLQQRSMSKSQCLSPERHSSKKAQYEVEQSSRRRSRSPRDNKQHNSRDQKTKAGGRSLSPKRESYRRQQISSRKLTAEELEKKRKEMIENAKWREEERATNVHRHRKEEERERALEKLGRNDGKFIHHMKLESASTSSLEDRVKRNIHSIQRTAAALEKNFMQR